MKIECSATRRRRKACTFYMVSEHAKIGVCGEEQVHAAVRCKPFPRLRE